MTPLTRFRPHPSRGAASLAWLLGATLLVLAAIGRARGREVDTLGEQLREHDDPDSLVVVSLGGDGVMAGTATAAGKVDGGLLGHVLLSGAQPVFEDGVHDLRQASGGVAVELVDSKGRVVEKVELDPPLGDSETEEPATPRWERVFLTVARALAARVR